MTFTGEDGREHRDRTRDGVPWRARRSCDGWPELGSCSGYAVRGSDYCRDCETLRRAHEGEPDLAETVEDQNDAD